MKYIVDCPSCGRKIRFPLDRGRIKIYCTCGYNTLIDPDDTSLYKSGKFDLKPENTQPGAPPGFFDSISSLLDRFTWNNFINGLLEVKYRLQNIRYLPDGERNRVIAVILFVTVLAALIIYYF